MESLAVPDTGSDIPVISGAYARELGLRVRRGRRHRRIVRFIDGSEDLTDGLVANLTWQFRADETPIQCDFHAMDRLPVDVILGNSLLDELDVFAKYDDYFVRAESLEERSGIYGISLVETSRTENRRLEDGYLDDVISNNPFTAERIERERARRDEIRDRIANLPTGIREE